MDHDNTVAFTLNLVFSFIISVLAEYSNEDPEIVRAKFFFRDEFLVSLLSTCISSIEYSLYPYIPLPLDYVTRLDCFV